MDKQKETIVIRLTAEGQHARSEAAEQPTPALSPRRRLPKGAPRACAEDCFEVDSACAHLPLHLREACRLEH